MDVDALIIELTESGRRATDDELAQIVAHVAQAPFARRLIRPPRWWREALAQCGIVVPTRVPAGEFHLLRRVYLDQQWPPGTTLEAYVGDLRQVIQHPEAKISYRHYGAPAIGLLAPSHMPWTSASTPFIFVAYSPQYGTLVMAIRPPARKRYSIRAPARTFGNTGRVRIKTNPSASPSAPAP